MSKIVTLKIETEEDIEQIIDVAFENLVDAGDVESYEIIKIKEV